MENVINFAARKKKSDAEQRVKEMLGILDSVYAHLNDAYAQIASMEEQCDRVQSLYDETLKEYVEVVGADNIPLEYLNYTNSVEVELLEGRVVLKWKEKRNEVQ